MAQREKGVASAPCPNCGTSLNAVQQPDGSLAYETCPKCYPAAETKETASHHRTTHRERGTHTDKEANDE